MLAWPLDKRRVTPSWIAFGGVESPPNIAAHVQTHGGTPPLRGRAGAGVIGLCQCYFLLSPSPSSPSYHHKNWAWIPSHPHPPHPPIVCLVSGDATNYCMGATGCSTQLPFA